MSTRTQKRKAGDRGRAPYRFTAAQLMKMIAAGIIADEDVELWDGIIYKMTKGELHNQVVMLTAHVLRAVTPPEEFHVREEKSHSDGPHSLPEADVTVQRGKLGVLTPRPPDLARVALVVEVDHRTARADRTVKFSRYAERRIPVYWLIKAKQRIVQVCDTPQGAGAEAHYARTQRYSGDAEIPIVLDGREVGRVAASRLFPVAESTSP
jgi:Uma2 family endonuclease